MANKYMILQGDGRTVQEKLDKFSADGYVPILYSTALVGAKEGGHPGIINHCVIVEKKEGT